MMLDYYEKPKKKKKNDKETEAPKSKPVRNFKIIDDDIDLNALKTNEEVEALVDLIDTDRPVIVTDYVEEKPKVVQKVSYFSNQKWVQLDVCENEEGDLSVAAQPDDTKFKKRGAHKIHTDDIAVTGELDENPEDDDLDYIPRRKQVVSQDSDGDLSPVRRKPNKREDDLSPVRKKDLKKDGDVSPVRRKSTKRDEEGDLSPVRKKSIKIEKNDDLSPVRRKTTKKEDDLSPIRKKPIKKEKEDEDLSPMRRFTRDDQKVDETKCRVRRQTKEEELKKKKNEEKKAKYMEWGKGLVQTKAREDRLKDDLYEADKPLARYKDDRDLDKLLKNVEREDDPMLEYLRNKKDGNIDEQGMLSVKTTAKYRGPPPPLNRHNLLPGSRWDGVDRSNGFEKRYYESLAQKKALQEEAYKWSVEDM